MPTIDFSKASAFRINVSNLNEIEKTKGEDAEWFKEAYGEIALAIRKIISDDNNSGINIWDQPKLNGDFLRECNNVIAISGDRGTGKSSVMHTILAHLIEDSTENYAFGLNRKKDTKVLDQLAESVLKGRGQDSELRRISSCRFFSLPPIDPTKLPKEETFIGHVVANIYKQIIALIGKEPDPEAVRFDSILEKCDMALEALRIRTLGVEKSMRDNPDDVDMLGKLANTSDLRKYLVELIYEFLKLKAQFASDIPDDTQNIQQPYLVIAIDDLDTNTDSGYFLAEEIRNFFFIPRVIILMAVKIEQLSDVVQQHFLSAFSKMIKPKGVLDVQPDEMATKYIQKLIPDQRRIHLPNALFHSMGSIAVKYPGVTDKSYNLVQYFLELIWRKSGILLVKNNHDSHGLIPLNLRGLHQIIALLESMPDVNLFSELEKARSRINLHANLRRLEAWLVDSVSSNAVPRDLAVTFRKMASHPNIGLNGVVVRQLREYASLPEDANLFGKDKTADELLDVKTLPYNISIGDVLYLLDKMGQYNSSSGFRHYAASIRFLYSIRLTGEFYPIISEDFDNEARQRQGSGSAGENVDYNEILEILSGLIYNPQMKITPTHREWMFNRNTTLAAIRGKDGPIDLRGNLITAEENNSAVMSLKDAIWLSFFAVQYGPRLRRKLPSSHREGVYFNSRLVPVTETFSGYISLDWLAFAHNILCPFQTVQRFLGNSFPVEQLLKSRGSGQSDSSDSGSAEKKSLEDFFSPEDIEEAQKLLDDITNSQEEYLTPLPLYCVDVINELIHVLERDRWRPRDESDILGKLNEYFYLCEYIQKSYETLLDKTAVGYKPEATDYLAKMNEESKARLIDALKKCPLLNQDLDVVKEYKEESKAERKFDWVL